MEGGRIGMEMDPSGVIGDDKTALKGIWEEDDGNIRELKTKKISLSSSCFLLRLFFTFPSVKSSLLIIQCSIVISSTKVELLSWHSNRHTSSLCIIDLKGSREGLEEPQPIINETAPISGRDTNFILVLF